MIDGDDEGVRIDISKNVESQQNNISSNVIFLTLNENLPAGDF